MMTPNGIRTLVAGFDDGQARAVVDAIGPWVELAQVEVEIVGDDLREAMDGNVGVVIVRVGDAAKFAWVAEVCARVAGAAVVSVGPAFDHGLLLDAICHGLYDHVVEDRLGELSACVERAVARSEAVARHMDHQDHFRALFNAMSGGVIVTDQRGYLVEMNAAAHKYLNLGPDADCVGRTVDQALPGLDRLFGQLPSSEQREAEVELPDGGLRTMGFSALESPSGAYRITLFRDLTPKIASERRHRRAEQLAQVGEMAARLSHEIKNPLASVLAGLELLGEDPALSRQQRELLREVTREARSLSRTVRELLSCARDSPLQACLTPVELPVREAIRSCRTLAESLGVELEAIVELPPSAAVVADEAWLRRALTNLIINGIEATGHGGKVQVRVAALESQAKNAIVRGFPGEVIVIQVRDDGPGLAWEHAERVFEPFFTTKAGGTGLGLSVAADVIESFGGVLALETRPGRGCSFDVFLPGRGVLRCWEGSGCDPAVCDGCTTRREGSGYACWAMRHALSGQEVACRRSECATCMAYKQGNLRPYWTRPLVSCTEE